MPAQTSVKSEMNTYNIIRCVQTLIAVLLRYILWTRFYPPPDLCLSMCKEFIAHSTISYVVFQNIVITTVL